MRVDVARGSVRRRRGTPSRARRRAASRRRSRRRARGTARSSMSPMACAATARRRTPTLPARAAAPRAARNTSASICRTSGAFVSPPLNSSRSARGGELAHDVVDGVDAEHDAFERGAQDRAAVVREVEAVERAAQRAVPIRCTLAAEERQHDEPFRARRDLARRARPRARTARLWRLVEQQARRSSRAMRRPRWSVRRRRSACRRRNSRTCVPCASRIGSSARMRTAPDVPSVSATSRAAAADADVRQRAVGRREHDGGRCGQAQLARDRRTKRAQRRRRRRRTRQRFGPTPASSSARGAQSRVRRSSIPVAEAMPWSISHSPVQRKMTSSLRPTKRRVCANRCAVVLGEPAQLRDGEHRVHRRAGRAVEVERGAVGPPFVGDRVRAAVHPGDDARERLAGLVDAQHAVHRARESDRRDLAAAHAHVGEDARQDVHRRAVDDVGILLHEVRMRRLEPVELRAARDLAPGGGRPRAPSPRDVPRSIPTTTAAVGRGHSALAPVRGSCRCGPRMTTYEKMPTSRIDRRGDRARR